MARIVFADTTGRYDGRDLERRAMGGTETSVIRIARELARRGHDVTAVTNCDGPITDQGVRWVPFGGDVPSECDLYVPIQHPALLGLIRKARRTAIWVLWQPNHLKHYKRLPTMWWHRPIPVLISLHQVTIYSPFLPRRNPHIVIPLGLPDDIRGYAPLDVPPGPTLLFASNPQRNLHGLVRLWADQILPKRPDATLRIFGSMVKLDDPWRAWSGNVLPADLSDAVRASIRITTAAPRSELVDAMRSSRAMIYFGHKCEAFCLSVAEAQALGLPCVVAPVTVLPERVIDGATGFVREPGPGFAEAALSLLNDDNLWRRQHEAALRLQPGVTWPEVAARFETALLSDMIPTTMAWPLEGRTRNE
ncbi:MAG: glycosyltransferase family 4 protein [Labrys sp. (in: a-proteobacteria)]